MSAILDPNGYPILLPHIAYHQGCVNAGIIDQILVEANEGRFLEACDGRNTLADIAAYAGVDPAFVASVVNWFIWWPHPVPQPSSFKGQGNARLVLAAAPEDPWLGMGGKLLCEATSVPTLILNCFRTRLSRSTADGLTRSEAALVSVDEAAFAARLSGVSFDQLDLPAGAAERLQAHHEDELVVAILRTRIVDTVDKQSVRELFVPAALGGDEDALLLFDTVIGLVAEGVLTCRVWLYQDESATSGERWVDELFGRFEDSFLELREEFSPLGEFCERKDALLRVFKHHIGAAQRRHWREGAALNSERFCAAQALPTERFWEVQFAELE
jgi:hypothetical protein